MKKSAIFLSILILFSTIIFVQAYGLGKTVADSKVYGHNASEIIVHVFGTDFDLQSAINANRLIGIGLVGGNLDLRSFIQGHSAENLLVKISGTEKSLQEAINSGTLCSDTSNTDYSSQTPTPGHAGYEILIVNKSGSEKLLQQAIDDREFCSCGNKICEPSYGESNSNCAVDCPPAPACPQITNDFQGSCTYTGAGIGSLAWCYPNSNVQNWIMCSGLNQYCINGGFSGVIIDGYNGNGWCGSTNWRCYVDCPVPEQPTSVTLTTTNAYGVTLSPYTNPTTDVSLTFSSYPVVGQSFRLNMAFPAIGYQCGTTGPIGTYNGANIIGDCAGSSCGTVWNDCNFQQFGFTLTPQSSGWNTLHIVFTKRSASYTIIYSGDVSFYVKEV